MSKQKKGKQAKGPHKIRLRMPIENLIKEQKKKRRRMAMKMEDTARKLGIVVHKCRLNILGKCLNL
uniref:MIP34660p1 n=1 Tax=Drosophila melanogaster TaxID=7227 RepID=H1UUQ8_DROME|nr:MIP34660p1 [Drosophila melanogaster]